MDAGDEFLAAEREAQRRQLPCLCIDLDMAPWPEVTLDLTVDDGNEWGCRGSFCCCQDM